MKKLLTLSLLYLLAGCKPAKMAQPALPSPQKMSCESLATKYCAAQAECSAGGVVKLSVADCVKAYKLSYCSTQASCSKKGANYDSATQCEKDLSDVAAKKCIGADTTKVSEACVAACVPALVAKKVEQPAKPAAEGSPLPGGWTKNDETWPLIDLDLGADGAFSWTEQTSLSDGGDYEGCMLNEKYNGVYFASEGGELSMYSIRGALTLTECKNSELNIDDPLSVSDAMLDRFDAEHRGQASVQEDELNLSFAINDYVMTRR